MNIKRCFNKASLNCLSLALLVLIDAYCEHLYCKHLQFVQHHSPIRSTLTSESPKLLRMFQHLLLFLLVQPQIRWGKQGPT